MAAIDVFAGAAGMSSGPKLADIERDPYAANTFHPSSPSSMDSFAAIPNPRDDNYNHDEV